MADREYLRTHEFLDFHLPRSLTGNWGLWRMLGEANSKCDHIAGVPLKPAVAQRMMSVYLTKGAHATTAIEGNTLSEEEVAELVKGNRTQPPSREYLEDEVLKVLACLRELDESIQSGTVLPLDVKRIRAVNKALIEGTEHEPNAIPGEFRHHEVVVPSYRAVPHEDVRHLTERTLRWGNELVDGESVPAEARFGQAVIAAVVVHAYLAWIHPFGDGNGRTARLVEAQMLARAGVPLPAVNLLSDHYNRTRTKYFNTFNLARESRDLTPFIVYAVQGFVDGLREQVAMIRTEQLRITWQNYVHEAFDGVHNTKDVRDRRKALVFALTDLADHLTGVTRAEIEGLTPYLARAYAEAGERTLGRDLNDLTRMGLIRRESRGRYATNIRIIEAYLPPTLSN